MFFKNYFFNVNLLRKYNIFNKTQFQNKNNKQNVIFLKYLLKFKKKRKVFKFDGPYYYKKNQHFVLKAKLNKEFFFLNFFIFNPFILLINIGLKKRSSYFYKVTFINFLMEILCSQYKFKKYLFLFKTKHRFR